MLNFNCAQIYTLFSIWPNVFSIPLFLVATGLRTIQFLFNIVIEINVINWMVRFKLPWLSCRRFYFGYVNCTI
jgi:hypothetical protein